MDASLDIESQIVASIRRIMRAIDLHSRHLAEEFGLTGPQLSVLQAVSRLEAATPGAIAREIRLSPATVTGIVSRLERRELLRRSRGRSDRRTVRLELTTAGERTLERAPSLLQDRFRGELGELEGWERSMILSVLDRIASMMDAEGLDAAPHLIADARDLPTDRDASEPWPVEG